MRLLLWFVTNALSLAAAAFLVEGIRFTGPTTGQLELQEKTVPLILVAVILGVVTSFVKPVLKFLSFPFIILTLGLFLLVINAAVLKLTAAAADRFELGFRVDSWTSAIIGSVVITVVTWVIDSVLDPDD
ncbi:MAG: phage holin family protein [Nocardioides sp.]|nr:phage holin family protein [Nocardioides sp.]